MLTIRDEIIDAACDWFYDKKPVTISYQKHLEMPTVNCVSDAERNLAKAVSKYLGAK